jgi:hypothetical protein
MITAICARILLALCCLLTPVTSASAECAWVLWEIAEHRNPRTGGLVGDWKPTDSYEVKRECDSALTRTATLRMKYGIENNYEPKRLGNQVTHWDGKVVAAVYTLQCFPDAVDPRGPKGK